MFANMAGLLFGIQEPEQTLKFRSYNSSVLKYVPLLLWAVFLGKHICPVRKRHLYGFSLHSLDRYIILLDYSDHTECKYNIHHVINLRGKGIPSYSPTPTLQPGQKSHRAVLPVQLPHPVWPDLQLIESKGKM